MQACALLALFSAGACYMFVPVHGETVKKTCVNGGFCRDADALLLAMMQVPTR